MPAPHPDRPQRWLITGASGQLGGHLLRLLTEPSDTPREILALAGQGPVFEPPAPAVGPAAELTILRLDLRDLDALRETVAVFAPTHVVHVGAMTAVGDCLQRPADAARINTDATRELALAAARRGARFVFSSTDMVFAGDAAPYRETDAPRPLSHYGRAKSAAERALRGVDNALVVRIPLLWGRPCTDRSNTFMTQLAALRAGRPLKLFTDEFRTPIHVADAAAALIALAESPLTGTIHVAGSERLSRYEMIRRVAAALGIAEPKLEAISRLSIESPEPRPADLSLDATRFRALFPALPIRPVGAAIS